jgi:hypothetical protein
VVGPRDWDTDAFESSFLRIVEGSADNGRVVPTAFCFHGVECVAEIPPRVNLVKEAASGDGAEL